jgi:hypothetical protein
MGIGTFHGDKTRTQSGNFLVPKFSNDNPSIWAESGIVSITASPGQNYTFAPNEIKEVAECVTITIGDSPETTPAWTAVYVCVKY